MRLLVITPQYSFPPSDGGKMEIYHSIKTLGTSARVWVALPRKWRDASVDDVEIVDEYRRINAEVILLPPVKPDSTVRILKNVFQYLPFKIQKYQSEESLAILEAFCCQEKVDAIWVIGLH